MLDIFGDDLGGFAGGDSVKEIGRRLIGRSFRTKMDALENIELYLARVKRNDVERVLETCLSCLETEELKMWAQSLGGKSNSRSIASQLIARRYKQRSLESSAEQELDVSVGSDRQVSTSRLSLSPSEISDLLTYSAGDKAEKQRWLQNESGIRIPRTNYEEMAAALVERKGRATAENLVVRYAVDNAGEALRRRLEQLGSGFISPLRMNEPRIVELCFEETGRANKLGRRLADYVLESTKEEELAESRPADSIAIPEVAEGKPIRKVRDRSLEEFLEAEVSLNALVKSASGEVGMRVEQVRVSKSHFLRAQVGWSERMFEEHIVAEWPRINWGSVGSLHLVDCQVFSRTARRRLDILALNERGKWVVIEIKIDQARDVTQIQSYLRTVKDTLGHQDVVGILLAPSFSEDVIRAACEITGLHLFRFDQDEKK